MHKHDLQKHVYFEAKKPKTKWEDIGGLQKVKERLSEMVSLPLKYPSSFKKAGLNPPAGVLLWGPPGGGKTLLAEAAAAEAETNYVSVKGIEIMSEAESIPEMFQAAKENMPCIVFINEVDALAPRREALSEWREGYTRDAPMRFAPPELTRQLFMELDGVSRTKEIVVIGATYRPDIIDPAILRNGRMERKIYVPPPNQKDRVEIFKRFTKKMPLAPEVDLDKLAKQTKYYIGADIVGVCREAALLAVKEQKESFNDVGMKHFLAALNRVKPSLSKDLMEKYEEVYREECKHRYIY